MKMKKADDREASVGDRVNLYSGNGLEFYSDCARFESRLRYLLR
jgi:hypothetical protein